MPNHIAFTTCNEILHNLYFFHVFKEQYNLWRKTRNKRTHKHVTLIFNFSTRTGGGGERDRTDDLLLAKQALSQLSYTPSDKENGGSGWVRTIDPRLIKTVL